MDLEHEISHSVTYLASAEAQASLEANCYWPKWNSPWWHMLLLYEMGEVTRIPESTVRHLIASLNAMPVKIFPMGAHDLPHGTNHFLDIACHCQVGSIYQLLIAFGADADREVPWLRPWFPQYQMRDGGMNCDDSAYRVAHECPSSMVGTISPFESLLLCTQGHRKISEDVFLKRAADFLVGRKLTQGSDTEHNASERASAPTWLNVCFPRFYHYDVLRGLHALAIWSEQTGEALPAVAVQPVVDHLDRLYPDGVVTIRRQFSKAATTIQRTSGGHWTDVRQAASEFPLLRAVSVIGDVSPYLSSQWAETRRRLKTNRPFI